MKVNEAERASLLSIWDEIGVSERRVLAARSISAQGLSRAIEAGEFPLPVVGPNGMNYWRLGDLARYEMGWA